MSALPRPPLTPDEARGWYPSGDGTHGFDHVLRVYRLAERIALTEGADVDIVRAAALLHDASPASRRADHQHSSAAFARQILAERGWAEEDLAAVEHAIRAHRFRGAAEPPRSLEAQVLFDADKLDAIGAVGVARALAYAAQHGQPIYARPSLQFIESGKPIAGEAHSAYHEYLFKLRHLKERLYTPTGRTLAAERHARLTQFFTWLVEEADPAA